MHMNLDEMGHAPWMLNLEWKSGIYWIVINFFLRQQDDSNSPKKQQNGQEYVMS